MTCGSLFEYVLEVDEGRVIAYVNEQVWLDYVNGRRKDYTFSTKPIQYARTSIVISPPIRASEVKARRWYRFTNGPGHYI